MKISFNTILLCLVGIFLVAAISLHSLVNQQAKDKTTWVNDIKSRVDNEISAIESDMSALTIDELKAGHWWQILNSIDQPIFIFKNNQLVYWSEYRFAPETSLIEGDYKIKYVKTIRREYIAVQKEIGDYKIIGILPIYTGYKIDNRYISSSFNRDIFFGQQLKLLRPNGSNEICYHDQCIFSIVFNPEYNSDELGYRQSAFVFYLLTLASFLIFAYRVSLRASQKHFALGLALFVGMVLSIRYLMVTFSIPKQLVSLDVLDSRIFASSSLNSSFGDLLLNIILLVIICALFFKGFTYRN